MAKTKTWLWVRFGFLMALIIPFIGGVSTIMAMFGTSGPAALSFDLRERVPQVERYIEYQTVAWIGETTLRA